MSGGEPTMKQPCVDKSSLWKKKILLRTVALSWLLIISTLSFFVIANIPFQKRAIIESLESEAKNIVASIDQVTATAVITEDYGAVVEHCMRVVKQSSTIRYVVITRRDGFSLVTTSHNWQQDQRNGIWNPSGSRKAQGEILKSDLVNEEVFHYSYPFRYSGIEWGWIHIGLTLKKYRADLIAMYSRTIWLAVFCSLFGMSIALYFAKKLSNPIRKLDEVTQRLAAGDLTARATITTGDELERLANSLNTMSEALCTSRKEIIASQDYTNNIISSMNDALIVTDTSGIVTQANKATLKLLGYTEHELLGMSIKDIFAGKKQKKDDIIEDNVYHQLFVGGTFSSGDATYRSKDGKNIPVHLSSAVLHNPEGSAQGMVCVAVDMTERKHALRALQVAKEEAVRASLAKSQFLANMSHEIRTPMNGVLGMTELLLETKLNTDQRRFAEIVKSSGESLLSLINSILDLSKIEANKLELADVAFDLHQLVDDSVELLAEHAHRKNLEFACRIGDRVPVALYGDPERLRQVLINLLANAIKFTGQGEVVLDVQVNKDNGKTCELQFSISDTGIGIEPTMMEKLFQPFTQCDPSSTRKHGGTGLGLAIAKQLSVLMGGKLSAESMPGRGSKFTVIITFRKQPHTAHTNGVALSQVRHHRVLVLDDHETTRRFLIEQMALWGMESQGASDSREALRMAHEAALAGRKYNIMLVDANIPGMAYGEFIRAVKADPALGDAHLVMLTPVGFLHAAERRSTCGIDACLNKPIQASRLLNCIVSVLNDTVATAGPEVLEANSARSATERLHGHVLLAEDNPINQTVSRTMLESMGLRVDVVETGSAAISAWSRDSYDLILMDCQMPVMDGYDATREIRAMEKKHRDDHGSGSHMPIIALTAHAMQGDRDDCLAAGMDDYLAKPFRKEQLLQLLRQWLPPKVPEAAPDQNIMPENKRYRDDGASDAESASVSCVPVALPEDQPAAIDRAALDAMMPRSTSGGAALIVKVIASYITNTTMRLTALRDAVDRGDTKDIGFLAHTMKSGSATVGAVSLAGLFEQLETMARSNVMDTAAETLQEIEAMSKGVFSALEEEIRMRSLNPSSGADGQSAPSFEMKGACHETI